MKYQIQSKIKTKAFFRKIKGNNPKFINKIVNVRDKVLINLSTKINKLIRIFIVISKNLKIMNSNIKESFNLLTFSKIS
jgi:hypothetical protein